MIIKCLICNTALTNELIELSDLNDLNDVDGEDFIPKGKFFISNGEHYLDSNGKIIINKKDLNNSINHTNLSRLNGCCGLDGMDGINKICVNGHEIGIEHSDCWLSHCVIFENELIKIEHPV